MLKTTINRLKNLKTFTTNNSKRLFTTQVPQQQNEQQPRLKVQPYFSLSHMIKEIKSQFAHMSKDDLKGRGAKVRTGGRIIGRRKASKDLMFLDLQSNGEVIQVMLDHTKLNDSLLKKGVTFKEYADACQRGAIVGIEGEPGRTDAGEFTIIAEDFSLLAACDKNLPMMNWNHKRTLKDSELRFQKRYLDLIVNNADVKRFFLTRAKIIKFLRNYLEERNFLEVETPILNAQAGGALAKPFQTESQVLRQKLELRIAPELFLKKLIIGGFERVYELGKVFRNEGIDATHNPEFTSLEFYMAYADYRDLITMTEDLLSKLAIELFGSTKVLIPQFDMDQKILTRGDSNQEVPEMKALEMNFGGPFPKYDVCLELGIDPAIFGQENGLSKLRSFLEPQVKQFDNSPAVYNEKQLIDKMIEHKIESKCHQPSFIMNHPILMSPLAKSHAQGRFPDSIIGAAHLAERFELFVNQKELINAYSEQNDSELQRAGFAYQTNTDGGHDEELHRADEDFIDALSYGMPPTAGFGCGIDRLCMLMCGVSHIREIILFPMFRTSILEGGPGNSFEKKKKDQKQKVSQQQPAPNVGTQSEPGTFA